MVEVICSSETSATSHFYTGPEPKSRFNIKVETIAEKVEISVSSCKTMWQVAA
jgi:hypothetical protein